MPQGRQKGVMKEVCKEEEEEGSRSIVKHGEIGGVGIVRVPIVGFYVVW